MYTSSLLHFRTHTDCYYLQVLATAIQQSNMMIASQVVRTEGGEERVVTLQSGVPVCSSENSGNDNLPAYLPDEDSPVKVKHHIYLLKCQ